LGLDKVKKCLRLRLPKFTQLFPEVWSGIDQPSFVTLVMKNK